VRRARKINRILGETYPYAVAELDFDNPFELLIATVLSAQTTDVRVNSVTGALFARYPDAAALASARTEEVEPYIQSLGFYRAKARSIITLSQQLVERHNGQVPSTLEELVELAGVGRKTANVVLGNAFDVPGLTVDTHFGRLARRMGFTTADAPEAVEKDVAELIDRKDWTLFSHRLVYHGRRLCHAPPGAPGRSGPWDTRISGVNPAPRGRMGLQHLGVQADDAVGPPVTVVDGTGLLGGLLDEQVEGVPHELHLVEGLVNGHRLGLVQLLTHDHRGVAELRLNGDTRLGGGGGGVLDRCVTGVGEQGLLHAGSCLEVLIRCGHGVTTVVVLLAVPGPAKALGQLAHGDIKSGEAVRGGGLRPDDRALGDDSDLHSLGGVGLARVALVGDLNLDALDPGVELLNLDGLVLDVVAQARADLSVTTDDGDIHGGTSF